MGLNLKIKGLSIYLITLAACFVGCTDYESMIDDDYEEWLAKQNAIIEMSGSLEDFDMTSSSQTQVSSSSKRLSDDLDDSTSKKKSSSSISSKQSSSSSNISLSSSTASNQKSSSSTLITSSSANQEHSSSSTKIESSSSFIIESSSSKASWAYLNPAISYGEMVDERDGQVYKTVVIGEQTWMAENLNFETGNSYCYNDSAKYCKKYGRLYTWAAAMDSIGTYSDDGKGCGYSSTCLSTFPVQGICPSDWHLPSKEEFEILLAEIGGEPTVGGQWSVSGDLKSATGWNNNGDGTDSYGFSAIPAGNGNQFSSHYEGDDASFRSSTEMNNKMAYSMHLHYKGNVSIGTNAMNLGFSVRCIKD